MELRRGQLVAAPPGMTEAEWLRQCELRGIQPISAEEYEAELVAAEMADRASDLGALPSRRARRAEAATRRAAKRVAVKRVRAALAKHNKRITA